MNHAKSVPSRWLYLVALLIAIISVMIGMIWLFVGLFRSATAIHDVQLAVAVDIDVQRAGQYAVQCDYTWSKIQAGALPAAPDLTLSLVSAKTGEYFAPIEADTRINRTTSGAEASVEYIYEVLQTGTYTLTAKLERGSGASPAHMGLIVDSPMIDCDFGPRVVDFLLLALRIGGMITGCSIVAFVLALTTHIRRHRAMRRLAQAQAP